MNKENRLANTKVKPNLLKPRWSKVLADLWGDKTRTALVVASIATGVFAVGMIITAFVILSADINYSYASTNPANIEIWTDPFYEDFVRVIEKVPGVADVEGRRILSIRAKKGNQNWQELMLVGIANFESSVINLLDTIVGTRFPGGFEVILSQDLIHTTGFNVGDHIEIELTDGSTHALTVAGLVTDQTTTRPDPSATANVFVSMETLRSLGLDSSFNRLLITIKGDGGNDELIASVAASVEDRIERNNRVVYRMVEQRSTEHLMSDSILAVMGVLGALGVLITVLSASLIVNTLNALLTQQLRQIGVMKLVGGRSHQILGMYLTLIASYSIIALVVAVPLGAFAGNALASFISSMMGAVLQGSRVIPVAVVVQVLIAFLVPFVTGFIPVNRGAKTNVRRAIANYRPNGKSSVRSFSNQRSGWGRWISRPILLSIRNTFRQKGRLLLTLFTLTVAGAVFIAVFNVRESMGNVMDQLMQHFMGDVTINFTRPYSTSQVGYDLVAVPGVIGVEGWGGASGEIWDGNNNLVTNLVIVAPPQDTQLLDPDFVAGRWLYPNEKKAIVVADTIYNYYPNIEPGDPLVVKITGNLEEEWEVVGIYRYVDMLGDLMAYANFDYISEKVNLPKQATSFRLITEDNSAPFLRILIQQINNQLAYKDYAVKDVQAGYLLRQSATLAVNTLIIFLLVMAVLTAFVGSIGLMGTMSINVLERTREIGVMRTIGAVDAVVMQLVIIEALVISFMTWVLAIILSFPISSALLNIIGEAMAGSTFSLKVTPMGSLLWLVVVIVLSIIASILPARNAARLTINEVLAYE